MQVKPVLTAKQIGRDQISLLFDSCHVTEVKKVPGQDSSWANVPFTNGHLSKQGNNWMSDAMSSKITS